VQTPTDGKGPASTFDAVQITVGCTITSIPNPTDPTNGKTLSYTLYDTTLEIDFSNIVYTQSPPCEYAVTEAFTFTIPSAGAVVMAQNSSNSEQLDVITLRDDKIGSYAVTMLNTSSYGGSTFTSTFSFTVTVVDPCAATVVTTFALADLTVINGTTGTRTFTEALDSIETTKNIRTLCGERNYSLVENSAVDITSWIKLTEPTIENFVITVTPTLDAQVKEWNLTLKVRLDDYAANAGVDVAFKIIISSAACDCQLITWDAPAVTT